MDLFDQRKATPVTLSAAASTPVAERVRPKTLDEFVGQRHLLGDGKPLRLLIEGDEVPSMIFWGPPGCGKTTLARIVAGCTKADFFQISAVSSGVQDVRKVIERAIANRTKLGKRTILFIDEIHRFTKSQQDALLHSVEDGLLTLIGATTENPSFEVISPLLSRCRVYVLEPLSGGELGQILDHAFTSDPILKAQSIRLGEQEQELLMLLAGGDARQMLNGIETAARIVRPAPDGTRTVTLRTLEEAFQRKYARYDKGGEEHYNIISAFIKSMRGCDPDGAVYWLARMLEGGEDPKFIARRMVVLASEDVGNADPAALPLATSCFTAIDYVGMPEARIILSQTAVYLASAPKSNAAYRAIEDALADVRDLPNEAVPVHLRNAPTNLMKALHYGSGYKYGHDYEGHFTEQQYLPEGLKDRLYYKPTEIGFEKSIRDRLAQWWKTKRKA